MGPKKELKYQSMTQLEHVLNRPSMYIGGVSNNIQKVNTLVHISENKSKSKEDSNEDEEKQQENKEEEKKFYISEKEIEKNDGFERTFIEPLSNAIDNVWRSSEADIKCTKIKIDVDEEKGEIFIFNDGLTVPVTKDEETGEYLPTKVFGKLLTSSNYDDTEERKTSGTNGVGVKCLGKNTVIPLYNGTKKLIQDITSSDILIGDDGNPRNILALSNGIDELYEINQLGMHSYIVNKDHTLCFKIVVEDGNNKNIEDIEISASVLFDISYDDNNNGIKSCEKFIGYQSKCVNWDIQNTYIHPYLFGIKLAKESKNYTTISYKYKINSAENRLNLLGGILDVCGIRIQDNIVFLNDMFSEDITNDIVFIARSLGFISYCSKKKIFIIQPNKLFSTCFLSDIPSYIFRNNNVNNKNFINIANYDIANYDIGMISISKLGSGEYYGIKVDENKKFVINDFTVTHNCTNIFSKEFKVTITDPVNNHKFVQKWSNNMRDVSKPKITSYKGKNGSTEISWIPDLEKFKQEKISQDTIDLFHKYAIDTAMITKIPVFFRKEKILIKTLTDYAKLYYKSELIKSKHFVKIQTDESEVVIMPIEDKEKDNILISFVNGIETKQGGVHVDEWVDTVLKLIIDKINGKKTSQKLTLRDIKPFFNFFINCNLTNPKFTSQEKIKLSSPKIKATNIETKHINSIMKWAIIDDIKSLIKGKELSLLKKTEKTRGFKKIEGYDPAVKSGTKESGNCSLILTEGLSARTFAIFAISSNIQVFGKSSRNYFGVFPLRGKLLNCMNASTQTISNNKEITNIIQILDLKHGVDYTKDENFKNLNYGRVICLGDSDADGFHINSLVINFFHSMFPSILKRKEPFFSFMRTPILRLTHKKNNIPFYSLKDFEDYKKKNKIIGTLKYYKGLGTSTNDEIKESFGKKVVQLYQDDKTKETMEKAFHSKLADKRKDWIEAFTKNPQKSTSEYSQTITKEIEAMKITDFIDNELILFSIEDCNRNIPNLIDSLKESQRKILFACFLKNLSHTSKELKVAQLAGFVSEKTGYHHGEQCLFDTITKMAQNFVGSNNINLLKPVGQFGSRLNSNDYASARYIFTKLEKITRLIYRQEDDSILEKNFDDGQEIEPKFYVPIIPMILVNGGCSIGTGWSCFVPNFNIKDIIEYVKSWIKDGDIEEIDLTPWYKGYTGIIKKDEKDENKFISFGKLSKKENKIIVDELPVGYWTDNFKNKLDDLMEEKKIKSYKNTSSTEKVSFEIVEKTGEDFECNLESLGLKTNLSLKNMVFFNERNEIKRYTLTEIVNDFCKVRYEYYIKRKKYIISVIEYNIKILKNKVRFLKEVANEELVLKDKDDVTLFKEMSEKGYYNNKEENNEDFEFNYLLNMNIRSFTKKRMDSLEKDLENENTRLDKLVKTDEKDLWLGDIKELEKEL
jgi:DNA topoisomerase-2